MTPMALTITREIELAPSCLKLPYRHPRGLGRGPPALVKGNWMSEFFLHSFNTLSHGLIGYIIPFLFVLTVVVFFHELGHFLVARWAGVKVLTFSLGFGPELAGFNDRHGTRWKISAIPLGGYVKFFGDASEASTPSPEMLASLTDEQRAASFPPQKSGPRAAVVCARAA